MKKTAALLTLCSFLTGALPVTATELTIATFNVSMEAENYVEKGQPIGPQVLSERLKQGDNPQIKNIAAIIQQVQPDIILLNEFDYIADPQAGVQLFIDNYLAKSQQGGKPLDYPYFYYNTVNTGQPSGFDLNNDGKVNTLGEDAWGFGFYPGQYGMVLLSRFPIHEQQVRTFQHFKWKDMPGHKTTVKADGSPWFSPDAWQQMPLSSKSHWDIPLNINGKILHILASHPTPPVFDGAENRNGNRNHDEVRFWVDYLSGEEYIYDDKGHQGGYQAKAPFVILGDLNSSPVEGDAFRDAIKALINHPLVNGAPTPSSKGGQLHSNNNPHGASHTAGWRMRADYVLPSKAGLRMKLHESGVFWPAPGEPLHEVVNSRGASSDHRLVWVKLQLE
ncbi:MAG TPA: endonuclease/exonuclease/phosphatase family protein [Rheinheimera sp.]|uniref:endonuclease/exonuclease/phosphatase family protein n=1 Tax=Rheinheimera sp. TaxID=1869214 RepID=UPI000ECF7906|nr:endonuclease/exonuclease/phosphatase family protein [Rheinheimera sp.]HCU67105.1 endonuclease/exonuclease/phosphatase family protein [Rheinheimera sp.]